MSSYCKYGCKCYTEIDLNNELFPVVYSNYDLCLFINGEELKGMIETETLLGIINKKCTLPKIHTEIYSRYNIVHTGITLLRHYCAKYDIIQ